jgi:hypothetical protein
MKYVYTSYTFPSHCCSRFLQPRKSLNRIWKVRRESSTFYYVIKQFSRLRVIKSYSWTSFLFLIIKLFRVSPKAAPLVTRAKEHTKNSKKAKHLYDCICICKGTEQFTTPEYELVSSDNSTLKSHIINVY